MSCGDCLANLARGVAGLAKSGLGVDRPDEATIAHRRDTCRGCEHATRSTDPKYAANRGLTTFSQCSVCNCFIAAKTLVRSEACPLGKWSSR
jgi:hypothetical protein